MFYFSLTFFDFCAAEMILQYDSNLVMYGSNGNAVWESGTNGKGTAPHRIIRRNDSNLVIYDSRGDRTWASNSNRK